MDTSFAFRNSASSSCPAIQSSQRSRRARTAALVVDLPRAE